MSNTRTYEELKQRLDAMADEMHGRKSEPNAAAKKQIAAYNSAFWDTMHTGMPNNELKVGSDGAGGYLVPDTYDNRLVMALEEENVLRKLGTTFQSFRSSRSKIICLSNVFPDDSDTSDLGSIF